MNKRGGGEAVLGWLLLFVFVAIGVCGFLSKSICDKLLIAVGVCGLLWLFFGSNLLFKSDASGGFLFFLFLTLILLIFWTILKGGGFCDNVKGIFNIPGLAA